MSVLLGDSANYGSDCGNATDANCGADASPSHVSQSDEQNANQTDSEDSEESEGSQEFTRTMQDASMAMRCKNIRKRKLQRLGYVDSDDEGGSIEFDSVLSPDCQRAKTPYRKLSMMEDFTPPRKKGRIMVRDSESEDEDSDENGEEEEDVHDLCRPTPKRIIQTKWVEVKQFSKSTYTMPDINHSIDAILAQSLKNAGYYSEHVSKTKDTDRAFWKEVHVSL